MYILNYEVILIHDDYNLQFYLFMNFHVCILICVKCLWTCVFMCLAVRAQLCLLHLRICLAILFLWEMELMYRDYIWQSHAKKAKTLVNPSSSQLHADDLWVSVMKLCTEWWERDHIVTASVCWQCLLPVFAVSL